MPRLTVHAEEATTQVGARSPITPKTSGPLVRTVVVVRQLASLHRTPPTSAADGQTHLRLLNPHQGTQMSKSVAKLESYRFFARSTSTEVECKALVPAHLPAAQPLPLILHLHGAMS